MEDKAQRQQRENRERQEQQDAWNRAENERYNRESEQWRKLHQTKRGKS